LSLKTKEVIDFTYKIKELEKIERKISKLEFKAKVIDDKGTLYWDKNCLKEISKLKKRMDELVGLKYGEILTVSKLCSFILRTLMELIR